MKRKHWIILAACIAILVAIIVWPIKGPDITKQIPDKNELVGMLKAQSQIASTEVTIRKMGIYDSGTQIASLNPSDWKLGRRVCVVPVDVTIRYGIDLNELKEDDLQFISDDSLQIRLPKPKIIDKSYDPVTNKDEIVTLSTGLRDNVGESTIQRIKSMAFEDVINQDTAFQAQLADQLTRNTEAVFTSLLNAIGIYPVYIK